MKNYYKLIGFSKESSYFSTKRFIKKDLVLLANKLIKIVLGSCNSKEHYKSFIIKENRKSVKQSEIITYQPKILQNLNIVDEKLIITGHPKTSPKLSKTIKQAKKAGSNSSF